MNQLFQLGKWRVNPSEGTICSDSAPSDSSSTNPIIKRIEPKALSVLVTLAKAAGQVVSRDALLDQVWANQVVGDDVINSSIATLRKALGDDRKTNRYIQTVPKKGYKLVKSIRWHEHVVAESKNDFSDATRFIDIRNGKERRVRNRSYAKFAILLGLSIFIFVILQFFSTTQKIETNLVDNSIAILPFDVYSQKTEMSYFADGLAEEMLHQLASNPQLKVIARSASFQYRNTEKAISIIGSELNAQYLIEGSVREFNDELKITVQLVDASKNYHLWSRVFDGNSNNLFKIQEDVGIAVSDMLSLKQPVKPWNSGRRHPQSDEAYKYFVMAQAHFRAANGSSYKSAEQLLKKAIEIAPEYALAYSSLAYSYLLQYQYNGSSLKEATTKASVALARAITLDPDHAEAFAAKGLMFTYNENYVKAEQAYLKAIESQPNLRVAHHNYAFLLWKQARYLLAIEHSESALAADPLAKSSNFLLGDSLAKIGYFDRAISHFEHCQNVLPEYVWCYSGLAEIYRITGQLDKALTYMEISAKLPDTGDYWRDNSHANLLIALGRFKQADNMLEKIYQTSGATYPLFHNQLLIALATDNMPEYLDVIDGAFKQAPEITTIQKFAAFSAYWKGDYQEAAKLYEALLEVSPKLLFQLHDYADGISHALNLADSYNKLGRQKDKQRMLMRIEQHFSSFSGRLNSVSGASYVKAKYDFLNGDRIASNEALAQLEGKWALSWLADKDRFWLNDLGD